MSEYRQDRVTGAWVIVAPERGRRPRLWQHGGEPPGDPPPPFDPACPFCPGNEHLLPETIEETPCDAPPGWCARVVPNKFPALSPVADEESSADGGEAIAGFGFHEVIIEMAAHDGDLTALSVGGLDAVVQCYRRRYVELMAHPGIESVLVFRNHGRKAGASLAHPHSQVIAMALTPPRLTEAADWARRRFEQNRTCVTCEQLAHELDGGGRVVEVTERFAALVPFAATCPFEMWILPRRHQASFGEIDDDELAEFARLLQRVLQRLKTVLEDPPYNYAIESGGGGTGEAPFTHWRLRIVPDLVTPGGFEIGSGLPINPSRPEDDAEALRSAATS